MDLTVDPRPAMLPKRARWELSQSRLDIEQRSRTSRLPWRGQFSPNLVEYLMQAVCPDSRMFLDPFCGSGTVLFEALGREASAVGAEVNPAAWHLASVVGFSELPKTEQRTAIATSRRALRFALRHRDDAQVLDELVRSIGSVESEMARIILAAALILGMGNGHIATKDVLERSLNMIESTLRELAGNERPGAHCLLADARRLGLRDDTIDGVITSPPYINVFNYHQNHRPAIERLGWKPLDAARSEIGANRKHRQNRFLTVLQYSLDMAAVLNELIRVMKSCAPLVIVLGRTSSVLGASFANGKMIERLLSVSGFGRTEKAERMFVNRYGDRIFEDILIAERRNGLLIRDEDAREVGLQSLSNARNMVSEKNRELLEQAIDAWREVSPSPQLAISAPSPFVEAVAR